LPVMQCITLHFKVHVADDIKNRGIHIVVLIK
jgi:hypothetical protein